MKPSHRKAQRLVTRWDDWLAEGPDWIFNLLSLYDRQHFTPFCWVLGHAYFLMDKGVEICAVCGKGRRK